MHIYIIIMTLLGLTRTYLDGFSAETTWFSKLRFVEDMDHISLIRS